jgi:hypothetical protein
VTDANHVMKNLAGKGVVVWGGGGVGGGGVGWGGLNGRHVGRHFIYVLDLGL